jgi:hypothetical protein
MRQSSFRGIQGFRSSDGLTACPPRIPQSRAAFLAQFQLKLGKAGENSGAHTRAECQ